MFLISRMFDRKGIRKGLAFAQVGYLEPSSHLRWSRLVGNFVCWCYPPDFSLFSSTHPASIQVGHLEALFGANSHGQRLTRKLNKPTSNPYFSVHSFSGVPNASPAASGHTTNDPQLLLHNSKPAHYHPTIPPTPGQHYPTVNPGPAPAFLQLPTTATAAKVSTWLMAQHRQVPNRSRWCHVG